MGLDERHAADEAWYAATFPERAVRDRQQSEAAHGLTAALARACDIIGRDLPLPNDADALPVAFDKAATIVGALCDEVGRAAPSGRYDGGAPRADRPGVCDEVERRPSLVDVRTVDVAPARTDRGGPTSAPYGEMLLAMTPVVYGITVQFAVDGEPFTFDADVAHATVRSGRVAPEAFVEDRARRARNRA